MTARLSIRLRLTLLYGVIVFVVGAVLLGAGYAIVERNLSVYAQKVKTARSTPPSLVPIPPRRGNALRELEAILRRQRRQQAVVEHKARIDAQDTVALEFLAVLVALTVPAAGMGYLLAGRALRPVAAITAMARRAAAGDLSGRIRLRGPYDELQQLAEMFDSMLARLESAFARQQAFVANASHELRTPLAIIRAELDATLSDPACDEHDLRAMAEVISDATTRCEGLIDRLLVLARSERSAVRRAPVDLASLARAATDDLARQIEAGSLNVRLSLDRTRSFGDPILLMSLIGNLIENGVRHNVPGGAISVRTAEAGGLAILEVENDGAVLAPADVPELFEPFRRLRRIAEPGLGAGLGLAIAQAVAVAHDGCVIAEVRPGGGLKVRVELPLAPGTDTAVAAAAFAGAAVGPSPH